MKTTNRLWQTVGRNYPGTGILLILVLCLFAVSALAVKPKDVPPTDTVPFDELPNGSAIFWTRSLLDIPAGWQLCDGTNDTLDLTQTFVIGADDEESFDCPQGSVCLGQEGGAPSHSHESTHTHEVTVPSSSHSAVIHTHDATVSEDSHTHRVVVDTHVTTNDPGLLSTEGEFTHLFTADAAEHVASSSSETAEITAQIGTHGHQHEPHGSSTVDSSSDGASASVQHLPPWTGVYIICKVLDG